jgi:hypothetical protein
MVLLKCPIGRPSSILVISGNLLKTVDATHPSRHTLITELAEGGASDQTIMDIAGHVSRQMLITVTFA